MLLALEYGYLIQCSYLLQCRVVNAAKELISVFCLWFAEVHSPDQAVHFMQ